MTDASPTRSSLLIDVELPDPDPLPRWFREQLEGLRVVLVGWYAVPEQTAPQQARDQFGDEAQAALDTVAEGLREHGVEVETRLVFTPDELDSIGRISTETNCDALLVGIPPAAIRRVLIPVRGLHNATRIARFAADLVQDRTTEVTLLHILERGESASKGRERVLAPMAERLARYGMKAGDVTQTVRRADDPAAAIVEAAADHDVVVIGETEPSVRDIIFGPVPQVIAREAAVPVMLVRQEGEDDE